MQRRTFLASSVAASALAVNASDRALLGSQGTAAAKSREYYELRRYQLRNGPQAKLAHDFFREGLVPGLNRLGINPVGVFTVEIGSVSPALYVLMPSASLETLVTIDFHLNQDADYAKAGTAFLNAPAQQPAYVRMESSLMVAFEGMPKLMVPPGTASTARECLNFALTKVLPIRTTCGKSRCSTSVNSTFSKRPDSGRCSTATCSSGHDFRN